MTKDGLARLTEARTKHGKFTKEKRAEARRRAQVGREIKAELRDIEQEAIAAGALGKDWRDQFK